MEDGAAEVAVIDGGAAVEGVFLHRRQRAAGDHDGSGQMALVPRKYHIPDGCPARPWHRTGKNAWDGAAEPRQHNSDSVSSSNWMVRPLTWSLQ